MAKNKPLKAPKALKKNKNSLLINCKGTKSVEPISILLRISNKTYKIVFNNFSVIFDFTYKIVDNE